MLPFTVYILKCNDDSYYVGHTDQIEQRISQHQLGSIGGYTSKRLPVKLIFMQHFDSRAEALVAERKIKDWSRKKKEALIDGNWDLLTIHGKKKFKKDISLDTKSQGDFTRDER